MKRWAGAFPLILCAVAVAAEPKTIPVWPDLDPALKSAGTTEQRGTPDAPNNFVRDIAFPTLTLYLPEGATSATPAIVICPGGGYAGVAVHKEGHAVAKWLNSQGVAGVILQYRMPQPEVTKDGTPLPLLDAREAIRLARVNAKEWNIDPAKVGIMGFSAGGHLASTVITHPTSEVEPPAFAVLIYPVISMKEGVAHVGSKGRLLGKTPDAKMAELYSNEIQVSEKTPPTFLIHAGDDRVLPENSILFYTACREKKVPVEMHLFAAGGHGFGLGVPGTAAAQWPTLCAAWMRSIKMLP